MEIKRETRSYDPLFPFTLLYMMIGEPDQKVNFITSMIGMRLFMFMKERDPS
ncbi:hypothetical protein [Metabacillus idriensis]|uniref:hypothetical protein n=1 Tax=Metabacillus idriensis TaxID=324768 RepID=UPI00174D8D86|nr:hypothetical protein [Metabacillus idriensis]